MDYYFISDGTEMFRTWYIYFVAANKIVYKACTLFYPSSSEGWPHFISGLVNYLMALLMQPNWWDRHLVEYRVVSFCTSSSGPCGFTCDPGTDQGPSQKSSVTVSECLPFQSASFKWPHSFRITPTNFKVLYFFLVINGVLSLLGYSFMSMPR